MSGSVGILNVGAGDTKLIFDKSNPQDCIRAARIVKDMLRRGYALLVDSGIVDPEGRPIFTRAYDFDETKYEYIVADFDPTIAAKEDDNDDPHEPPTAPSDGSESPQARASTKRGRKRVSAASVNAVAVARSAGG